MKKWNNWICLFAIVFCFSCNNSKEVGKVNAISNSDRTADDSLLTTIQHQTFKYFWDGAEPKSGMAPERININGIYPENDKGPPLGAPW